MASNEQVDGHQAEAPAARAGAEAVVRDINASGFSAATNRRSIPGGAYWFDPDAIHILDAAGRMEAVDDVMMRILRGKAAVRRTLKRDTTSKVDHLEGDLVVKYIHRDGWRTRLRHLFRATPAWREWRNSRLLWRAGIRCNPPVALVQGKALGAGTQALVYRFVPGRSLDHYLDGEQGDDAASRRRRLMVAEAMGGQFGRLAAKGLVNRDHKPGNILIDEACERDGEEPILIDASGIRPLRSIEQVWESLEVLRWETWLFGEVTPREMGVFVRAMAEACPALAGEVGGSAMAAARRGVAPRLRAAPERIGPPVVSAG